MKGLKTKAYIDKLIAEKGIPYIDFSISVGKEEAFRYYAAKDGKATGKEKLWLFSANKPMTVVAAMRLVEEGKLSLDDEVAKYLPAYKNTFLADGTPTKNKMLVRHLFTMSAGFSYAVWADPYKSIIQRAGKDATTLEIINALSKAPLLFEPGERFEYSLCHDVLAAVVEVVSGKRFSAYMDEVIFKPLGMNNTGFHTEKQTPPAPYYLVKDEGMVDSTNDNFLILTDNYDSGGAGAIGNVEDYAKFARALALGGVAENGYRLIGEESLKQIYALEYGGMEVQSTFTCAHGDDYGYGLGVRVRKEATSWGLPKGEFGWDGALGAYLLIDPEKQISVAMGMHILGWPTIFKGEHLNLVQCAYEDLNEKITENR